MKLLSHSPITAFVLASALAFYATPGWTHGDEDHGPDNKQPVKAPSTAQSESTSAKRLPDGSLFVPKVVQRQLGVRTQTVEIQNLAATVELNGRVIADPNAGGRVQASQAGRLEAGANGLPRLGQVVVKGQTLLWLRPISSSIERGNQRATLAEIESQLRVAESKAARYAQLEGAVPQKDIETAKFELTALQQKRNAVGSSLGDAEALLAPVSGVVSASNVISGQVVEAREILLEIVDPARLSVEALAYDPTLIGSISSASVTLPNGSLILQYVGAARQLREQALPMLFSIKGDNAAVAVGQSVKVIAKTTRTVKGGAVAQAAIARNSAGETVVWVHAEPERFVQRRVTAQSLDSNTAAVTHGLAQGERVVSVGANLLAQVR